MGFYYHDLHLDGPKSLDEFLFPAMRFPQRRIPAAFLYTRGIIVFRKERLFFYFGTATLLRLFLIMNPLPSCCPEPQPKGGRLLVLIKFPGFLVPWPVAVWE